MGLIGCPKTSVTTIKPQHATFQRGKCLNYTTVEARSLVTTQVFSFFYSFTKSIVLQTNAEGHNNNNINKILVMSPKFGLWTFLI
jgi:hypothetical protein